MVKPAHNRQNSKNTERFVSSVNYEPSPRYLSNKSCKYIFNLNQVSDLFTPTEKQNVISYERLSTPESVQYRRAPVVLHGGI